MMESIVEAFSRQLKDGGDREALWSRREGLRQSFTALEESARVWQRCLPPILAKRPGDGPPAVAVAVGNVASFIHLTLALLRSNIPMVAMDGTIPHQRKLELCRNLGIAILLHRDGPQHRPGEATVDGAHALPDGVQATVVAAPAATSLPLGTALVKLTSGSTGEPLGVCLGAESLAHGIRHIGDGMALSAEERVLLTIPLSHSYGFDNGVLSLLALGTPLILEPGIFPASMLKALAQSAATFLPLVPPLVRSLGQSEWPSDLALRRVICAGGVLHGDQAAAFFKRSGRAVQNFFGSTETGGISFEASPLEPSAAGTVGHVLPGVRVTLDDAMRVSVDSPANRLGLIGRRVTGAEATGGSGPVMTGDTGSWTNEGRLRLTGRTADFLDIGGRKVPAARVEEALRQLPGVRDVAVVGVDDAMRGERTVAFLVAEHWPVDCSAVAATLLPREMRRLDALPYNERGKLERQTLRRLAVDGRRGG